MRLAAATISSVLLFSRLIGLFGHGEVDPGEKIDALHPFPTAQTSIRYPLYSIIVIVYCHCSRLRIWFDTLAIFDNPGPLYLSNLTVAPARQIRLDATIFQQLASGVDSSITWTDLNS
jgi:hypothetical protein